MSPFNPNAYGNSVRKTNTTPLSESRWAGAVSFVPQQASEVPRQDHDSIVSKIIKPRGNVVVQSVSLLSSPRQVVQSVTSPNLQTHEDSRPATEAKVEKQVESHSGIHENKSQSQIVPTPKASTISTATEECDVSTNQFGELPPINIEMATAKPSTGDRLRMLQGTSMQQISRKVEGERKKGRITLETSSLKDLHLARKPVDLTRPEASGRSWLEAPPTTDVEAETINSLAVQTDLHPTTTPQSQDANTALKENRNPPQGVTSKRSSRWPDKAEMRAEKLETDSNAWGSDCPSDATKASNISNKSFGKLLNKTPEMNAANIDIGDWEGKWMPAPADWHDRPRYNNNNEDFRSGFQSWLNATKRDSRRQSYFSNGLPYTVIAKDALEDMRNYPDGIGMVSQSFTINYGNASRYGYMHEDREEHATKYAGPVLASDFEKWDRLNTNDYESVKFRDETTDKLVENWIKHAANARHTSTKLGMETEIPTIAPVTASDDRFIPDLNIYLRPATEADLEEMTRVYNLHIEHGLAPTETSTIAESDMAHRMNATAEGRLPFIVAAKMNQKGARLLAASDNEAYSQSRNLPVQHRRRERLSRVEMLAGFACAMDLTAADFVEHTSAELEVYVDPAYKKKGVGTCLLDKLLQLCDRNHQLTTSVDFHCAIEIRHLYQPGGIRDIHKMYMLVRKWHIPRVKPERVTRHRKHSKAQNVTVDDNDYETWKKGWLEYFNFEVEGTLNKVGAKNGRYVDLVYLGRETSWSPVDGHLPPPEPRHVIDAQDWDDGSEDEHGVAV